MNSVNSNGRAIYFPQMGRHHPTDRLASYHYYGGSWLLFKLVKIVHATTVSVHFQGLPHFAYFLSSVAVLSTIAAHFRIVDFFLVSLSVNNLSYIHRQFQPNFLQVAAVLWKILNRPSNGYFPLFPVPQS